MQQLKVSTNKGDVSLKKKKIAKYIIEHPEGCTPKMISTGTSININTVKSILPKLKNIEKVTRGWYKVVNRGDDPFTSDGKLTNWNFHNLILSVPLCHYKPMSIQTGFNLINIDINISDKGLCTLRLSSDYPLNVSSICLVYAYLKQFLGTISSDKITMKDMLVKSIEFNKDYSNLKFEGVNCITLDGLCTQFKAYQKKIGLRTEHKTKVPFHVETMVDMLTGSPANLELNAKLKAQEKLLEKLTTQAIYNTAQLTKLIDKTSK